MAESSKEKVITILQNLNNYELAKRHGMRGIDLKWAAKVWLGLKEDTILQYLEEIQNSGFVEYNGLYFVVSERGKKFIQSNP